MQIVRVVIVRVIVDGVHGVTIVVLIGHDEVLVIYVAIFVSGRQSSRVTKVPLAELHRVLRIMESLEFAMKKKRRKVK